MRTSLAALLSLLALPAAACTSVAPELSQYSSGPTVAPVSSGLTIPAAGAKGWNLEQLLRQYARATDQQLLIADDALMHLRSVAVPLEHELVLRPSEVHFTVQSILAANEVWLFQLRATEPRIVVAESARVHKGSSFLSRLPFVPANEVELWRDHPAYPIQTLVYLDSVDTTEAAITLGSTLPATSLFQIVPLGQTRSVLLAGTAPQLYDLITMLDALDSHARVAAAAQVQGDAPSQGR